MTKSQVQHWEHFPHGADIGVRGRGETLSRAFEQAALALTGVITDPDAVKHDARVEVHCAASDRELLLVDWLNALIFEMATRGMLFSQFEVTLDDGTLTGTLWGEAVDVARHQPAVEVKGATYTELKVACMADGSWVAQCVVDV
jgi:tRNA nucleotidyltransferase (CCA-adding enzyme)